ncbi:MAG: cytidine deaminase [Rickettsiaceae bacterium]|nr:cytidine deaminase [Rickettsiaceae bacterium]
MGKLTNKIVQISNDIKEMSYSPYSKFRVGACILTTNGNIYSGCNIESCSYGATLCAEASALASMVSGGDQSIAEIAITCSNDEICYPCGICLQRLLEFSTEDTIVHLCINAELKASLKLLEMLPFSFNKKMLINHETSSCII